MGNFIEYLMTEAANKSLSRLYTHTLDRNIGIVTAFRGNDLPLSDNRALNNKLEADIKRSGFGYFKMKGRYVKNFGTPDATPSDEESFLIIGKNGNDSGNLLSFLKKMGEKYQQESILYKPFDSTDARLVGTSHTSDFLKFGQVMSVGTWHPNRAGEFHSVMKGGRTFAFEEKVMIESLEFISAASFSKRKETVFAKFSLI